MRAAPSTQSAEDILMLDLTWMLGGISAALLAIAGVVWATQLRGPWLQRLDGVQAANDRGTNLCIQVLMLAFALSAVAATLAITRRIFF
jgi:hypothetical protein